MPLSAAISTNYERHDLEPQSGAAAMKHTILFVDDEFRIRQLCQQELEKEGYCVLVASDGVEAIDVVGSRSVELVVLDEHMRRCNGLDAAKKIKRSHPLMPIILFTADDDFAGFVSPLIDCAVLKSADLRAIKLKIAELLPSETAAARS